MPLLFIVGSIDNIRITPNSYTEFLEGVEQDIVCSVIYMCSNNKPRMFWDGGSLHGSTTYIRKQGMQHEARSTLKFTAKAADHGKTITCRSEFKGNVQRVQITLRVKSE